MPTGPAVPEASGSQVECLRQVALRCGEGGGSLRDLLFQLAAGRLPQGLFRPEEIAAARTSVVQALAKHGFELQVSEGDVPQAVQVRLLEAVLKAPGDPNALAMPWYAKGVPLGVDIKMPRARSVYDRKSRWALPEDDADEPFRWAVNHPSAQERPEVIAAQFEEDAPPAPPRGCAAGVRRASGGRAGGRGGEGRGGADLQGHL